MSKLTQKQIIKGVLDRVKLQDEIRAQYGDKVIFSATKRLCQTCKYMRDCELIPVTTEGKDCPYYAQRKLG